MDENSANAATGGATMESDSAGLLMLYRDVQGL
jgi:hypothetical protein